MKHLLLVLAAAWVLLSPDLASACAVCFDPNEESRFSFLIMTIVMSLLPLALIGGTVLWLRHRAITLQQESEGLLSG